MAATIYPGGYGSGEGAGVDLKDEQSCEGLKSNLAEARSELNSDNADKAAIIKQFGGILA